MRTWIRQFLGITDFEDEVRGSLRRVHETLESVAGTSAHLPPQIEVALQAMGRIIAKIDPMYGRAEDDPARVADSARLGEEVINRLMAENTIRREKTPR